MIYLKKDPAIIKILKATSAPKVTSLVFSHYNLMFLWYFFQLRIVQFLISYILTKRYYHDTQKDRFKNRER